MSDDERELALKILVMENKLTRVFHDIENELREAVIKYPLGFHSNHEAYGTMLEEFDELWDEIKAHKNVYEMTDKMKAEAIQVAAMAIRFILDRYYKSEE
jgi:hypothetical protein